MSHRRVRASPIREVELRITVEADKGILDKISRGQEGASSSGSLSLTIRGKNPILVAKRARRVAEIIRDATKESERV